MSKRSPRAGALEPAQQLQFDFYASAFDAGELEEIERQLAAPHMSTEMEVAVMRVMIRRVMKHLGAHDPVRAMPLIRQGVNTICRALRTERVLTGESSDSLTNAFAVALREIGEEVGLNDE